MADKQSAVLEEIKKNIQSLHERFDALEKKVAQGVPKEQLRMVIMGPPGAGKVNTVYYYCCWLGYFWRPLLLSL